MIFALKVVMWIELAMIAGWFFWRKAASPEFRAMFDNRYLAAILAIPFICFMSPRLEPIHFAAMLIVPLLGRTKAEAVAVFALSLFLFPELAWRIQLGGLWIADVVAPMSLTVGLLIALAIRPGRIGRMSGAVLATVLAFCALQLFILLRPGGLPVRPIVDTVLRTLLPVLLLATMVTARNEVRRVFGAVLLAGVCLSVLAILETARSWPIYQEVYQVHGIPLSFSSAAKMRGGVMRAPTTFAESTSFAILLAMCVLIVGMLRGVARSRFWQAALIALFSLAMLAAMSRGAFIGLAVGFVAAAAYRGKAGKAGLVLATAVLGIGILRLLSPYSMFLSGVFNTQTGSGDADYRVGLFNMGVDIIRERPLTGIPLPAVYERLEALNAPGFVDFVNTYLYFGMVGGVPGMLIFALLIAVPALLLLGLRRTPGGEPALLFAMLVSCGLLFFFTSYFERNPYWIFLSAALTSVALHMRETAAPPVQRPSRRPADHSAPALPALG